jgi:hypothetical protein
MKMTLSNQLPEYPVFAEGIRRAPDRGYTLSPAQTVTALKNALRYIPVELQENWLLNFWRSCGPGDNLWVPFSSGRRPQSQTRRRISGELY